MSVKVSGVVATVSVRACVCAVRGGGNPKKSLLFVRCSFDVIDIVAINYNIFIQLICFSSGLNLYDGQLFIHVHVQFHVHIMKLVYVCS